MTPARWQQIKEILYAALERAPAERAAFLARACAGDDALRAEVESLLASYDEAGGFITRPAMGGAVESPARAAPGRRVGPYQLLHELGHGGMGAVYLAVRADDQYRQQVAIKLVRRGLDTDFILSRFRHERQILASFDHPNIARLLDGGTTEDGLPYFVMEHIEGELITEYCDAHRLNINARLRLFRTICAAVHYAHQNLVIHRDIKPSNILVTAGGVPKLLDFGIAKILNPELSGTTLEPTATGMRLMTPEYASPEQARGEPITTATDVYSLGVVLYQLLTGHRPYRFKSYLPHEVMRAICEQEPERPSTAVARVEELTGPEGEGHDGRAALTPDVVGALCDEPPEKLRRRLSGDLDNIVLMAMRKDPTRRYLSVEQFSEDLRRHLVGLPVSARKDTLGYRAGKFVRRHRAGVAAVALLVLTLIGGIVATAWQANVARRERAAAERRFGELRELANSYLFELHDAIEKLPGSTPARELLVRRGLSYLDRLAREASGDQTLQQELAKAYVKVGDVQGRPGFANLGDRAGALESYRKALGIRETLLGAGLARDDFRLDLATNHDRIGDALRTLGDAAGALEHYRRALALREELLASGPGNPEFRRSLATSSQRIADMLALTGKPREAAESQRRAVPIFEELAAADPQNLALRRDLFIGYIKQGDRLIPTGGQAEALGFYRRALGISAALSAADPLNGRARRELAVSHDKVGNALAATGATAEALASYRQALAIREALSAADPTNAEVRRDLSISYDKIGEMLTRGGETAGALAAFRRALAIDEALSIADPTNGQTLTDRGSSHEKIGDLLVKAGDPGSALGEQRRALALRERVAAADPANIDVRRDVATSYAKLGEVCARLAQLREARAWYQKGLDVLDDLSRRGAAVPTDARSADEIRRELAKLGR